MRIGGYALVLACVMAVPASYVILPWLMGAVGMMPMDTATRNWQQVEDLVVPFALVWALAIILAITGRAARDRHDD